MALSETKSAVDREMDAQACLDALLEAVEDAIVGISLEGRIESWNRCAEKIFGHPARQVLGRPIGILIPAERVAEEERAMARVRRGEIVSACETVRVRADGERVSVSLTMFPTRNLAGETVGAIQIAHDISEQKKTVAMEAIVAERTAHLKQTIAELEGVSYSLSHDLRGPLRTIQGFAQLVLEDAADRLKPEEKDLLNKAIRASHRLDRLIQDVLTYTRVSRQTVTLQTVDVERLLRQIIDERPELRSPRADIQIVGALHPVRGHEASLTQVITNLLDNAVKFVPPERQPKIRIQSRLVGDSVELSFADNGIGIARAAQPRLFAIFQRVHDDKKYAGTGIGLAIVRKAVERMGGTVTLESEEGVGSTFLVQLPKGCP